MTNGVVHRRDIDTLSAAELAALRSGYRAMQAITDNRGFNHISGFHGVPSFFCHNESPYLTFLPWHRAYLYWFERHLRDHDNSLAVPYWDWTSTTSHTSGVPAAFRNQTAASQSNPLFQSVITTVNGSRPTRRSPLAPGRLATDCQATKSRINALLSISDFVDFSIELENFPHNAIHGWTGGGNGDMGSVNFAAYDPIFYSHHCMVDRIWHLWQQRHGEANIPSTIRSRPLAPFNLTVRDVLKISNLGYNYN